jgi:hypothetical protein
VRAGGVGSAAIGVAWSGWKTMEMPAGLASAKPLALLVRILKGEIELHVSFDNGQLLRRRGDLRGIWSKWIEMNVDPFLCLPGLVGCGARSDNFYGITNHGDVLTFDLSPGPLKRWPRHPGWPRITTLPVIAATNVSRVPGQEQMFIALTGGGMRQCEVARASQCEVVRPSRWSNWVDFVCPVAIRALASSSAGPNHQEVFALAKMGRLIHSWWSHEDEWSEWAKIPLPQSDGYGPPVAIASHSRMPGHQELFLAYKRGPVFHKWRWNHSGWSDWDELHASQPIRALTSCGASPEHQEVFALTADRKLVHARYGPA